MPAPRVVHFIPEQHSRCLINVLQVASVTPEPMGNLSVTIQRNFENVLDTRNLLTHMDEGNAGYAWSYYLPRRRRKYVHVGNADYTGAIICLPQIPDIKHLVQYFVTYQ